MEKKVHDILAEYDARMERETALMKSLPIEEGMKRRDEFLLPVGKEVGQFLGELIKSANSKSILEVGTSFGYSTVWLAQAAKVSGGKVITLEIDKTKSQFAEAQIKKAGLEEQVEFRIGDAIDLINHSKERFDFVLIDIWKELYLPSFRAVMSKLNPGAYLVGDNMIHPPIHKEEVKTYRSAIKASGLFESVLLPLGSGIDVSRLVEKNKY